MRCALAGLVVTLTLASTVAAAEGAPQAKPPEQKPSPEPKKDPPKASVSGFVQLDYRRGDDAGQALAAHEFNYRRARLSLGGSVKDGIDYVVTLQAEPAATALLDVNVDFRLKPMMKLRVGQFKYDFDMDGRESSSSRAFFDRPWITNTVAGSLDGTSNASVTPASFRDRGATLLGDSKDRRVNWGYSVGVFQGSGRASDSNDAFSYVIGLRLYPVENLRLNAGYLFSDNLAEGKDGSNEYSAWTAGAQFERAKVSFRGEYYWARRDLGTTEQDVDGFYVYGSYSPVPSLDLLARYQWMQDGRFVEGSRSADSVDLGVKWYFNRRGARAGTYVSANYSVRGADKGFNRGPTLLNDGRGAALTDGSLVKGVFVARVQFQF